MKNLHSLPNPVARSTRSRRCRLTAFALSALLLASGGSLIQMRAATAPPGTLLWTTTNNAKILGGMATIGSSGVSYFSTLSTPSTWANVRLNPQLVTGSGAVPLIGPDTSARSRARTNRTAVSQMTRKAVT